MLPLNKYFSHTKNNTPQKEMSDSKKRKCRYCELTDGHNFTSCPKRKKDESMLEGLEFSAMDSGSRSNSSNDEEEIVGE